MRITKKLVFSALALAIFALSEVSADHTRTDALASNRRHLKSAKDPDEKSDKSLKVEKSFKDGAPTVPPTTDSTKSSKKSKKKGKGLSTPVVPTPPTTDSTKSTKKSKKKGKGLSTPVVPTPTSSPSEPPPTEPSTEPPTTTARTAIILTLPVCATDCESIGIALISDPFVVAEFQAAATAGTNIDPNSVAVELVSQSACRACGAASGGINVRKLQIASSRESDVQLKLVINDTNETGELSEETVSQNIRDKSVEIESVFENLGASTDVEQIVVEESNPTPSPTEPPTPSPVMTPTGTSPPNSRVLKSRLFGEEVMDIAKSREELEYDDYFIPLKKLNFEARMQKGYNFLSEFMYDGEPWSPTDQIEANRVIVAYSAPTSMDMTKEKNEMYHTNFQYFLDNAVDCSKHSTLIITTDEVAEAYRARIEKMNGDLCGESQYSVTVSTREDKCYDMESMATFVRQTDPTKYDYFLYVNCGMIGPKMLGDEHWTKTFTSKLSNKVKLVGVSINMSFHPHVQSMVLATDRVGFDVIKNSGAIYDCGINNNAEMTEEQRWKLIMKYEIGMSRVIVEAGYTITSLTGVYGNPIFIDQGDIEGIKNKSLANMIPGQQVEEIDYSIWNSEDLKYVLPLGDDIWNADTIRSMANGKLPPWSDFVFYKASRLLLLPDIIKEVHYNNQKYEVVKDSEHSISELVDPTRDICEEAKTNFREASKLGVLITGLQHSGTTMLSQLIKSAPGLFGGFECGILMQKSKSDGIPEPFNDWLEWSTENDLWALNDGNRDLVKNAKCIAEKYYYLHQYSPLFHAGNRQNDFIVDKTPDYVFDLVRIMDITPDVPVIVTTKSKSSLYKSWKKRGHPEFKIDRSINTAEIRIKAAMKKYPDRIKLVNTTEWTQNTDEVLSDIYEFLGKEWKSEYLNMDALNIKRAPGSVVSVPFLSIDSNKEAALK